MAAHDFGLKCYFMQKPLPELDDAAAVADIHKAIEYLSKLAERSGARVSMHLNPTFADRGTPLAEALLAGTWSAPRLVDVARAVRHTRHHPLPIYVGLSDEGLAVPGGSFRRPQDADWLARLEAFNRTGDLGELDER